MMATHWGQSRNQRRNRKNNRESRGDGSARYLALDSAEFRLFLFFSLLSLIAIGTLVMSFFFGLAELFGVIVAFVIVMFATTAGTFLPASVHRFIVVEEETDEEEEVTQMLASGDANSDEGGYEVMHSASGDANLTLLASASLSQSLSEKELATRREFFDFLYQVVTFAELGETTWAEKGMPRADYRICMDYLARLGIVQKQNGAKPVILTRFHEALRRIALDKRDENFWADALNYHTLINSTYAARLRQSQQTSSPGVTTSAADSSVDATADDFTDEDSEDAS